MKTIRPFMNMFANQRNAEHYDTHYNLLFYIDEKAMDIPDFSVPYQTYKACFLREKDSFQSDKKSPETEQIIAADKLRMHTKRKLHREVAYMTYSDASAEQEAARLIKHKLWLYRDAGNVSYTDSSAMFDNLVADLREEPCSTAIATLRLESLVDLLYEQNKVFMVLYRQRGRLLHEKRTFSLKESRRQTDLAFKNVTTLLTAIHNSNYIKSPTGELTVLTGDLIDALNSYLARAQRNLIHHAPAYTARKYKPSKMDSIY